MSRWDNDRKDTIWGMDPVVINIEVRIYLNVDTLYLRWDTTSVPRSVLNLHQIGHPNTDFYPENSDVAAGRQVLTQTGSSKLNPL